MENVQEAYEQVETREWVRQWLDKWNLMGGNPRAYTERRTYFMQLIDTGTHNPELREMVAAVVRALGEEATEYVQLAYVIAGRPTIKG